MIMMFYNEELRLREVKSPECTPVTGSSAVPVSEARVLPCCTPLRTLVLRDVIEVVSMEETNPCRKCREASSA